MGTRSGDIDSIVFYMVNTLGYSLEDVNNLLLKESGMLGLTGFSDLRNRITSRGGNASCQLALDMNAYRIKTIGSYTAVMNGLDAIILRREWGEFFLSGN
jgi:acetate kinase